MEEISNELNISKDELIAVSEKVRKDNYLQGIS